MKTKTKWLSLFSFLAEQHQWQQIMPKEPEAIWMPGKPS
jgi:hypothetical protein